MEAILSAMDDGVLVLDPADTVVYANPAASRFLNTPLQELVGQPIPFAVPAGKDADVDLPAGLTLEIRVGSVAWHEQSARLLVLRDITTRKEQSEQLYRILAQNLPGSDVGLVDHDYRYILADGSNIRRSGFRPEDLAGKSPREAFGEEVWRVAQPLYAKALAGEAAEAELEAGDRVFCIRTLPVYDGEGRVYAGIGLSQDITVLKQTEREVRSLNTQLEELLQSEREARQGLEQKSAEVARLNRELEQRVAQRTVQLATANAELEAFAYSVSHDLRGPLRHIDGFSEALREDCADRLTGDGQHYLMRICAATRHMGELIDSMLALSQISRQDMDMRDVDLSAMARAILTSLAEQAPARRVQLIAAPGMRVRGDESFLQIALENLFDNAWKFTSKTADAVIELGVMDQDGERVFFVRDNGAGFDPSHMAKLFGTFERLHSSAEFPGSGIGLATVKRVIERHGGRIWAQGAVNRGATFYFTLPAGAGAEHTGR